jgi:large subunit ribosomal protein L4
VHLLEFGQLNTYDVLCNDVVIFTQGAYDQFVAGPAKGKSATAVARSSEVEGSAA